MLEVVELLDGEVGGELSGDQAAQEVWTSAVAALREVLGATTIADVVQREAEAAGAQMYHICFSLARAICERLSTSLGVIRTRSTCPNCAPARRTPVQQELWHVRWFGYWRSTSALKLLRASSRVLPFMRLTMSASATLPSTPPGSA